jgi:hypothetical protein
MLDRGIVGEPGMAGKDLDGSGRADRLGPGWNSPGHRRQD